jgi:LAO/AO transport system kinase
MQHSDIPAVDWKSLRESVMAGDSRLLARAISFIENEVPGYLRLLEEAPGPIKPRMLGITGPPGAGKSTLADALIGHWVNQGKKLAVLCVDPSSAFHQGALLGDRIRMSDWYNHPQVFIRSLSSRGTLGGLHPKIIEITDLLKLAAYDLIIVETVGVGQNEVEVSALADITLVVLVPGAGDEIQIMKAGLLEIANIFVLNKADQPEALRFENWLRSAYSPANTEKETPIIKTIATEKKGIAELAKEIEKQLRSAEDSAHIIQGLTERAYLLIAHQRTAGIRKKDLKVYIANHWKDEGFSLYKLAANWSEGD